MRYTIAETLRTFGAILVGVGLVLGFVMIFPLALRVMVALYEQAGWYAFVAVTMLLVGAALFSMGDMVEPHRDEKDRRR